MNNRFHRRVSHGMVLIEVILALTIFTLVAFSLVMTLDTAMDSAKMRNEIEVAVRGIQNQIDLIHFNTVSPIDQDLPDDGSGVFYHLTIAPEQMQDQKNQPVPNMYRATITAQWRSGKQLENRSFSELIYQP